MYGRGRDEVVDPKYAPSKTQKRAELAETRIPQLCAELIVGARELNERSIELLYSEYRAYHCSRRPFHQLIERTRPRKTHLFNEWSVSQILDYLRMPRCISKEEALSALYALRAEITIKADGRQLTSR